MKTNILASALVLTFIIGLAPAADAGGRFWGRSSRSGPAAAAAAAAAKARAEAAAREKKVNEVKADLKTAIANDPSNAAKYTAAAVQILGIDTNTARGRSELTSVQSVANTALRSTPSFSASTPAQKAAALNSIRTESRNAVGTAPTMTQIIVGAGAVASNPLNFPQTLPTTNPLISATLGLLVDGTGAAGDRASTLFAGLGFPSGTNLTTQPASDGSIAIVVNPPVVTQGSPTASN